LITLRLQALVTAFPVLSGVLTPVFRYPPNDRLARRIFGIRQSRLWLPGGTSRNTSDYSLLDREPLEHRRASSGNPSAEIASPAELPQHDR